MENVLSVRLGGAVALHTDIRAEPGVYHYRQLVFHLDVFWKMKTLINSSPPLYLVYLCPREVPRA